MCVIVAAGVTACGADPTDPGPPVEVVEVTPPVAFLDPGDTLRLTALTLDVDGEPLADPGLTWRSLSGHAVVDTSGLVTGVSPGEAVIEAVSTRGLAGSARIRVTPVSAIQPDTGRYGQMVTLHGPPPDAAVWFTAASGDWVPAFMGETGADAIQVWVPVNAADGPLRLVVGGDTLVTSRGFRLTAAADVYAGLAAPAPLPFPYHNPSLLASSGQPHGFRFSVTEATPFSLHLVDRGPAHVATTVRAWLFRVSPGPATLMSFMMTRDHVAEAADAVLDSVVYSLGSLPPGEYVARVAAMDVAWEDNPNVWRAFGLRLGAGETFALAPDGHEPNDSPAEAPVVGLPFAGEGLRAENPYAMDHYAIDLAEASTVTVVADAAEPWLLLYLMPGDAEDILAAWEADDVVAEAAIGPGPGALEASVPPGRYTLLVWDWAGRARPYDLGITAEPATASAVADHTIAPRAVGAGGAPPHPRRAVFGPATGPRPRR